MKSSEVAPFYAVDLAEYLFMQITEQVHPGLGICMSIEGRPQRMLCERVQLTQRWANTLGLCSCCGLPQRSFFRCDIRLWSEILGSTAWCTVEMTSTKTLRSCGN